MNWLCRCLFAGLLTFVSLLTFAQEPISRKRVAGVSLRFDQNQNVNYGILFGRIPEFDKRESMLGPCAICSTKKVVMDRSHRII